MPALSPCENPFRVSRMESLVYRDGAFHWPALLDRLAASRWRGAIVGPHGSGKTTLLLELEQRLALMGLLTLRLFLNASLSPDAVLALPLNALEKRVVLLDGAEQLGPLRWRRFLWRIRPAAGLVITTHTPGRLPMLHACSSSRAVLDELLEELCGADAQQHRPMAHRFFEEENGNLRAVFFRLYDHCAHRIPL